MQIIPAVDLLEGKVVRLEQGNYAKAKFYSDDPKEVAKCWVEQGARSLHVVDLDGARDGIPANLNAVSAITKIKGVEVEFGGGVRNYKTIEKVFKIGVKKVVLGTAAVMDEVFAAKCLSEYGPDRIVFSVDMKKEDILLRGWKTDSGHTFKGLLVRFQAIGLKRMIYTDIMKDGMMAGPNMEGIEVVLNSSDLELVVAGGISSMKDINRLVALRGRSGKKVAGVIIGKALYEGKINLREALNAV